MATFTKRIDSGANLLGDKYVSARTPNWVANESGSYIAVSTEEEIFPGEWYGGVTNDSFRFTNVTIPPGAVITSAKITFTGSGAWGYSHAIDYKFIGVDEDNTGAQTTSPIDDARTRTHTTAEVDWHATVGYANRYDTVDSPELKTIIQEIIDRANWASGNALGIYLFNHSSTVDVAYFDWDYYSSYPNTAPLLTITYETGSASVSPSASMSPSLSPSSSASPSTSVSPSVSSSISLSPSPSPMPPAFRGLKIAKPGVNVLTNSDVEKLIFSSEYGTLKYLSKQQVNISFDANAGDITAKGEYVHNLNKYLFAEVYVRVYIGSTPSGNYQYCPFYGAGATIFYSATFTITPNKIIVYGQINGMSTSVWHFDFLIFVYNNDLKLS